MTVDSIDALSVHERPVTASIAAKRLGVSVRSVQRWATKGLLPQAACIVATKQPVYWEIDVMRAEAVARRRNTRYPTSRGA